MFPIQINRSAINAIGYFLVILSVCAQADEMGVGLIHRYLGLLITCVVCMLMVIINTVMYLGRIPKDHELTKPPVSGYPPVQYKDKRDLIWNKNL